MSRHLWYTSVLATSLLLLLDLLIVQGLLLLLSHVAASARHSSLCLWHGCDIIGGGNIIGSINPILGTGWLGSVEACLWKMSAVYGYSICVS
jgi:hypothetical protein